ncbi:hypothetical protein [Pseudomonas sp. p99-361]|uniref:hypothetical protein n=1 Tax=Pseudomonas sp. p99-361 TaxID=2479852 RepID=UPI000F7B2D77|nr:hypothetical protein [Pseudomonas sp. p99-361]RRV76595.1 hypothetical protein EGJ15_02825 [Pseudomonas sp. p99-361]
MPTENRSSNTEMVSVPTLLAADSDRDMLEYLAEAVDTQTYVCDQCGHEEPLSTFDIASDLRDYMLAFPQAPAPKPHPDPIAWMVGTAFWWTKEEAERDAADTGLPIVGLGPMPDTGTVDQLSQIIRDLNDERDGIGAEAGRLRAQLAEAHALLRTQDELLAQAYQRDIGTPLKREIRENSAALSASAEPSAPVERDDETLIDALRTCETWFIKHSPTAPLIGGFGDAEHPMLTCIRAALECKP